MSFLDPIRPSDRRPSTSFGSNARVRTGALALIAAGVLLLAGCGGVSNRRSPSTSTVPTVLATEPGAPVATTVPVPPPGPLTLAVEPEDGYRSVDRLIAGAVRSVDMTMYELSDPRIESLLIADHRRGVAVRVLLDRAFRGATVNQRAMDELSSAGVPVRWSVDSTIVHQKTISVDGAESAIMTGNLTARYEATTRDFVVFDQDPTAVAATESVFTHDWAGGAVIAGPTVGGLVWSPGALSAVLGLVERARHSLLVENEEMAAPSVTSALEAAAGRGVDVTVIMTGASEWHDVFTALAAAGVHVVIVPDRATTLYVHAKAIVADDATAFVGSQNFSDSSLDRNRELGLVTADPSVVAPVARILGSDALLASPLGSPGTPAPTTSPPEPAHSNPTGPTVTIAGCAIDPEGRCYRSSEYCPNRLHGQTVQGASGPITCTDIDGWRWEPAS